MDLSIQMRIIYNVKKLYAIRFKFWDKFLIFLTKLVLQVKFGICSAIKEHLLLYCLMFSAFVVVVVIYHKETPLIIETINLSLSFQNRHLNGDHSVSDIKLPWLYFLSNRGFF